MTNLKRSDFQAHPFHLVSPSPWPLYTSISLLTLTCSGVLTMHAFSNASYFLFLALITLVLCMSLWWRDVISEGTYLGNHTLSVQRGLNMGVALFIVSEALFFLAIFWAYFHSALSPTVELGAQWPPMGIEAVNPFELPLINTVNRVNNYIAVLVKIQLYEILLILHLITKICLIFYERYKLIPTSFNYTVRRNSTLTGIKIPIENLNKFYEWFVGFSDAESMFIISPNISNDKIQGITFKFVIGLHKDDLPLMNYIQARMNLGRVYLYSNTVTFTVNKMEEISKLINIFDNFHLNTSKYLDYLDFKKAFNIYKDRNKSVNEIYPEILKIKSNMNTSRSDIINHKINISKNWLIGFIEGDGSFNLSRDNMEVIFSIKLTEKELPVLLEIKNYFNGEENIFNLDKFSYFKLKNSNIIKIYNEKGRNNSKPLVALYIKNLHFINNYLLPYFNTDSFISKKSADLRDFKIITRAIYIGAHLNKQLKWIILKLSYTMNNFRLSTGKVGFISEKEKSLLINAKPSVEHLNDGRELNIISKKIIHRRSSSCVYEVIDNSGKKSIKLNLQETAKLLDIGFNNLKRRLDNIEIDSGQSPLYLLIKDNKVRRIRVFNAHF